MDRELELIIVKENKSAVAQLVTAVARLQARPGRGIDSRPIDPSVVIFTQFSGQSTLKETKYIQFFARLKNPKHTKHHQHFDWLLQSLTVACNCLLFQKQRRV
jgi:hypothetical protein